MLFTPLTGWPTMNKLSLVSAAARLGAAIAVFVLAILVFRHLEVNGPTVTVAGPVTTCSGLNRTYSPELCPTDSTCTRGYYVSELDACTNVTVFTGTACSNTCYESEAESTVCSDDGTCEGDTADCRGYCTTNASCVTAIPFDTDWLTEISSLNVPYVLDYQVMCTYGQCQLAILDWFYQLRVGDYGAEVGSRLLCKDFLSVDFPTERLGCLDIEWFLLDTNLTDTIENNTVVTLPNQFRMCTFRYMCAPFDETLFNKRSAASPLSIVATTAATLLDGVMSRVREYARRAAVV